jgi:hypothetical protein
MNGNHAAGRAGGIILHYSSCKKKFSCRAINPVRKMGGLPSAPMDPSVVELCAQDEKRIAACQTAIRIRRISAVSFFRIFREYRSGIAWRNNSWAQAALGDQ